MTIELTPLIDRPCQLTFFRLSNTLPNDLADGAHPSDVYQGQSTRWIRSRNPDGGRREAARTAVQARWQRWRERKAKVG